MRIRGIVLCLLVLTIGFSMYYFEKPKTHPYIFTPDKYFPKMPVSEKNPTTVEGVELGRMLFYDPILSKDSSVSCATCHQQKNAFSDRGFSFSKGIKGDLMARNTPPLFNLAWYDAYFWDGRAPDIETQIIHPLLSVIEMNMDWCLIQKRLKRSAFYPQYFYAAFGEREIDDQMIRFAIAQFERTLISNTTKFDRVLRGEELFTADEYAGYGLVNNQTRGNCLHCHLTDGNGLGTTGKFSNNGLDAVSRVDLFKDWGKGRITKLKSDYGKFRIPSLRNVIFTAPYMHDGRFETLEEVIDFYSEGIQMSPTLDTKIAFSEQGGSQLTDLEKAQIIAFIHTLSDSDFVTNPAFSNPFLVE